MQKLIIQRKLAVESLEALTEVLKGIDAGVAGVSQSGELLIIHVDRERMTDAARAALESAALGHDPARRTAAQQAREQARQEAEALRAGLAATLADLAAKRGALTANATLPNAAALLLALTEVVVRQLRVES